jgi:hypothetical protein
MGTHWLVMDHSTDTERAPYRARLAAAGRQLPQTRLTTDELMAKTRHNTHIDLERLTGIRERRVSVGDEDSYTLAVAAAQNCLATADRDGGSLDVVISCSITKLRGGLTQWLEPTMSGAVARAIGAADAMTFDVSNACAGTLTGVTILNNWMRANALRVARWVSAPAVVILATFGLWTQLAHGKGWTWLVLGVVVVALLAAVTLVAGGTGEGWAFLSTSVMVGGVVVLIFGCLYPNLLPSTLNPDWSLTIFNSSSSPYTLRVMTWAALIVAPLVVAYQAWSYWVFRQRISAEHVVTAGGLRRRPQ